MSMQSLPAALRLIMQRADNTEHVSYESANTSRRIRGGLRDKSPTIHTTCFRMCWTRRRTWRTVVLKLWISAMLTRLPAQRIRLLSAAEPTNRRTLHRSHARASTNTKRGMQAKQVYVQGCHRPLVVHMAQGSMCSHCMHLRSC